MFIRTIISSIKNKYDKQYFKDLIKKDFIRIAISWILNFYINLVYMTSKIIVRGDFDNLIKYIKAGKGVVLFTWHGRMLVTPAEIVDKFKTILDGNRNIYSLSSVHNHGRIGGEIMKTFEIQTIWGSTINPKKGSSGNTQALSSLREVMKKLYQGNLCVFTPDGPRGPAYKMNTKITNIVQKTHTAIMPTAISYKRKKQFNTWDNFQLPYPFNKIIIDYTHIFEPKTEEEIEDMNHEIEQTINQAMIANDKELEAEKRY